MAAALARTTERVHGSNPLGGGRPPARPVFPCPPHDEQGHVPPVRPHPVESAVARIRQRDPVVHAFVSTRLDAALDEALQRDAEAERSPLHGLPYSLKDQWETTRLPTTAGSTRFHSRYAREDAPIVAAMRAAGAVLVGKTNLSDLGLSPEASSYVAGATRNPQNLERTAGGSSGGAAAAVADEMVAFDWGTDIGGSIRLPAAFCGVYGLRLSSESWPIRGMFPEVPSALRWMLGQGPIARDIETLRAVLDAAAPTMRRVVQQPFEIRAARIYAPGPGGQWPRFASDARQALSGPLPAPKIHDAEDLPDAFALHRAYSAVWCAHLPDLIAVDPELSIASGVRALLSSLVFRGRVGRRRFHPRTAELLTLVGIGHLALFRNRNEALWGAEKITAPFRAAWARGEVIVMPTVRYPAPPVGRTHWNPNILTCTIAGNLADATGLSMPFGQFDDGLPRGLQLLGPPGSEDALLALAEQLPTP